MLETSQALAVVFLFATVIQFCVERVKELVGSTVMNYVKAPIWALAFGIVFAFMFELDAFAMFGYATQYTIAARVLTGFMLSAGAAPIHDLIEAIRNNMDKN